MSEEPKNPNAVALGSMGRGIKKTMTPEAIRQRREMTKARVKMQKAKRKEKPNAI